MKQSKKHIIIIVSIVVALFSVFMRVRTVFAEEIGNVVDGISQKLGFEFGSNTPKFIFSKLTPNYVAYAGDEESLSGHKARLERDGSKIDLQFIAANILQQSEGEQQITLTHDEVKILDTAEQHLEQNASDSAILMPAIALLQQYTNKEISSDPTLLLIQLKAFKIQRLSLDIDLKLADLSREVSTVMSRAKLVEEERERVVTFSDNALGLEILYRLNEGGMHQEIHVATKENTHSQFYFEIDSHGLIYKNMGNGVWYFYDGIGAVFRLPKGYAKDAAGMLSNDVQAKIEKNNGKDILTFVIPQSWMTDESRVYPVTVFTGIEVIPELRQGNRGPLPQLFSATPQIQNEVPSVSITASPTATATATSTPISSVTMTPTETPEASVSASPTHVATEGALLVL